MSGFEHGDAPIVSTAAKRVLKASAFIASCVVICVVVQFAFDASCDGIVEKLRFATASEDVYPDGAVSNELALLPEGFQEEVLPLSGREGVQVGAQGSIVGFIERADAPSAFAALAAELEDAGWTKIESGREDCGSFVKNGGRFTWLFVSCTWSGESTSVVISNAAPRE